MTRLNVFLPLLILTFTSLACGQDEGNNEVPRDIGGETGQKDAADVNDDLLDTGAAADLGVDADSAPDMMCETERIDADPTNLMTCHMFCEGLGLFCSTTSPMYSFSKGGLATYDNGVGSFFECDVVPEATDGEAALVSFACHCTCAEQP